MSHERFSQIMFATFTRQTHRTGLLARYILFYMYFTHCFFILTIHYCTVSKWNENNTTLVRYEHLGQHFFKRGDEHLPEHWHLSIMLKVPMDVRTAEISKLSALAVHINTESHDIIHIVHMVARKMKANCWFWQQKFS